MKTEAEILYEAMDSGEWAFVRNQPVSYLTDEWYAENQWSLQRTVAPFCGKDGVRHWSGPTPSAALNKARLSLRAK